MRIIAGRWRGRPIQAPPGRATRPTTDRVREAWMSAMQQEIPGARVLDLFAGSGALGLEALSRGADAVDFVEMSRPALAALRANIATLDVETRVHVHVGDALRFVAALAPRRYDLAFADPPYRSDASERLIAAYRATPFAGILGIEHAARTAVAGDATRRYGDTALTFCYAP